MTKIIISLGGSIVSTQPDNPTIRQQYADFLLGLAQTQVVAVIVGGGYRARQAIDQAKATASHLTNDELDQIGIQATRANAASLQALCGSSDSLIDPQFILPDQPTLVFGAGWIPGRSTDYDAVLLAVNNKIDTIYNVSNISYIYSADPKTNPTAQPLAEITWERLRVMVGDTWTPGLNLPFDPIATQLAAEHGLTVKVMHGGDLKNISKAVRGEDFVGTVIHS